MDSIQSIIKVDSIFELAKFQNISDAFFEQAKQQPSKVAIYSDDCNITYSELAETSIGLANILLRQVTGQSQVVAIYGKRSPRLVLAILACARAHLTFAVLDSAYPLKRIEDMLKLINPSVLIGIDIAEPQLDNLLGVDEACKKLSLDEAFTAESINVRKADLPKTQYAESIAYLLFTSGTTGLPKCIKTKHSPLIHFIDWYAHTFQVSSDAQFSMLSGLGHDPILRDIFVPLSIGATLHIPDNSIIINPPKLFDWFHTHQISYAHLTPQLLKILCAGAGNHQQLPNLEYVFCGGDALKTSHAHQLGAFSAQCQLVNFYGTTETPQAIAYHLVKPNDLDPIPVGHAISDVSLHLLGEDFKEVSGSELGQIGIETEYLSDGYLHDEAMTKGRFVESYRNKNRIYLTGDYGMRRPDGALVIKGRIDDQVKIRGFRVELGEIVTVLEAQPHIQSAVVLPELAENGEYFLVSYLVKKPPGEQGANNQEQPSEQALNEKLKSKIEEKLPSYMVPNHYVWLERLPLLPNGKLDRAQLPKISATGKHEAHDIGATYTPLENTIINQWKAILGQTYISNQKSFTALGGDSLSFIQASLVVEKTLGYTPENWEKLSIQHLANLPIKGSQHIVNVESRLLFRALSIVFIVMTHFTSIQISATHALFFISGISLATFQLNQTLVQQTVKPILSSILKIIIPTYVLILAMQLMHLDQIDWYNLTLTANLHTVEGELRHFWFIEVLIQSYLIIAILFTFQKTRVVFTKYAFAFSITSMSMTIALAILTSGLFFEEASASPVAPSSPLNRLWLIFLGIAMVYAHSRRQKLILSLTVILGFRLAVYFEPYMNNLHDYAFSLPAILLVIFMKKIAIPKFCAPAIHLLASSSLFIYITHMIIGYKLPSIFDEYLIMKIVVILLGGILCSKVWEYLSSFFFSVIKPYFKIARQKELIW